MSKIIFVIGVCATGKSYFIKQHFSEKEYRILNIYDYQEKAIEDAGYGKGSPPYQEHFALLMKAQQMIIEDAVDFLQEKQNVVVEHTLFKTKRRIDYIDRIRKDTDADIEIYVMNPSERKWKEYIKRRELDKDVLKQKDYMEFPNPAEGFGAIYEVVDGDIRLRMDDSRKDIVEASRKALIEEKEALLRQEKEKEERRNLLESMNTRKFWHYCEVCGKKEYLTADEAHETGWDYPPKIGYFGLLGPRTCRNCRMVDTLFWKINRQELPIVIEKNLSPEEKETWDRIKKEPESLLDESEDSK